MWIAKNPTAYDCGYHAPDGSAWEIHGETYDTNPKFLLTESDWLMLDIFGHYHPNQGSGYLPEAGGIMDQSAKMMEALRMMGYVYKKGEKIII